MGTVASVRFGVCEAWGGRRERRAAKSWSWLKGMLALVLAGASLSHAWLRIPQPLRTATTLPRAAFIQPRSPPFFGPSHRQARREERSGDRGSRSVQLTRLPTSTDNADYPVVTVRRGFSDFRSDTVTKPTPQMRKAMYKAEVGDDVYREDPTVDELEREIAAMMGHEAALFVPSRTMGNLIAVMIWCSARGSSFICGEKSHIFLCEEGGAAQFGGVSPFPIPNELNGTLDINKITQAILDDNEVAQLITLENPVDRCGGRVMPMEYMNTVAALAKEHNMKLHLDGSRIWNAAAHLGVDVRELTCKADSITVCVSKGLGAPAGSLLIGSRAFVEKARKMRKALGGAMRQVGVLAAAGLVALRKSLPRIRDDHDHAKKLARGVAAILGLKVDVNAVETNIVFVDVDERLGNVTASFIVEELQKRGVLALAIGPRRLRMVTHYEVSEVDVRKAIHAFDSIMEPYVEDLRVRKLEQEAAAAAAASEAAVAAAAAAVVISAAAQSTPPLQAALSTAAAAVAAAASSSETQPSPTPVTLADAPPTPLEAPKEDTATPLPAPPAVPDLNVTGSVARGLVETPPPVVDTTATTVASGPPPVASAQDEETAEEVSVFGATTCEEGFALLLSQPGQASTLPTEPTPTRALKVVITPCDPMSCGLDVTQAETPEAVTVLQLLQDIDVGSYLRHDALAALVGLKAGHPAALRRVLIQQTSGGNRRFRARLDVEVAEQNSTTASAVRPEDLTARRDGGPVPTVSGRIISAEVKEPFQAMALAFRHGAKIWVSSRLLREQGSYDVADLRQIFPDLLEIKPGMKQTATAIDMDVAYEIGRLERQLRTAMDEGNEQAQQRIRRQLDLYSTSMEEDLSPPLLEGPGGGRGTHARQAPAAEAHVVVPQPQAPQPQPELVGLDR